MEDLEFSDAFCRFIQSTIQSVEAAELLLLFHRRQGERLSVDEAIAKLGPGVRASDAALCLERFEAAGLLVAADGGYRYRAAAELDACVETLAQAYAKRPVTLVRVIYALRDSRIRSFADAFKIKK